MHVDPWALQLNGSALLSIHPKFLLPGSARHTGLRFLSRASGRRHEICRGGKGQYNRACEAFVSTRAGARDHKRMSRHRPPDRRAGRISAFQKEVRRSGFAKFTHHASVTQAQSRA
jgi:hypothetical protein